MLLLLLLAAFKFLFSFFKDICFSVERSIYITNYAHILNMKYRDFVFIYLLAMLLACLLTAASIEFMVKFQILWN